MVAGQLRRTSSRTSKSRRRPRQPRKRSEAWRAEIMDDDESAKSKEMDRLLVSALRLWEVERDLIEESLAARGC